MMMDREEPETSERLELGELKGVAYRQRWPFLLALSAVWLVVWAGSWILPSYYRSGTLILIEQPAVPEKLVATNINSDMQQQLDSISEQILSRTRLLHIIDSLGLYAPDQKRRTADEMVEKMRKDIGIELVRGDNRELSAFHIYYTNRDPGMAQKATQALADLFMSQSLADRQGRSENTTRFLQEQLLEARRKLEQQEARVREFKDKHLGELPSQTASNLQILTGLQSQMQAQQDALNQAKQRNTYLESLVSQQRQLAPAGGKGGDAVPGGLAAIDHDLDQLKGRLADLTSHYTENHPDVRKTKEQIARTEKMRDKFVADMNAAGSSGEASAETKSAAVLELESELKANRIEIANHEGEVRDLRGRIGQYQSRLNMSPVMEQQFADITRDYDQSKADYDSLLAKKNQSEMATNLEKTQQGEHFRMLDPPNWPGRPYQPNRLKLCGLGLGAGLLIGAGVAVRREKASGKVHTEKKIKQLIAPLAVIAEIPAVEDAAEQEARRRADWRLAAAAAAMVAVMLAGSAVSYLYG
jgi:succinoglycan biosynthesis transport protein ExoP